MTNVDQTTKILFNCGDVGGVLEEKMTVDTFVLRLSAHQGIIEPGGGDGTAGNVTAVIQNPREITDCFENSLTGP